MAREKMSKVRESAVHNSWLAPAIGAGVGALVAKALQSRAQSREDHGREDYYGPRYGSSGYRGDYRESYGRSGYRTEGSPYQTYQEGTLPSEVGEVRGRGEEFQEQAGSRVQEMEEQAGSRMQDMKERAGSKVDEFKGRAGEMRERVGAKTDELKGRMTDQMHSFRERLPDRGQIRASTHEDTGIWALGAAALGVLFGFALPVSEKERQVLEPAKRKARELGAQAKDMAVQKGSQALDQASERLNAPQGEHGGPQAQGEAESPPALH